MDASLDLSRWSDTPRGVGYRRWTIISTGLRQLFRLRFFKILLALAWGAGVVLTALGFLFSQSVASGGWLETLANYMGPRGQAVSASFSAIVLLYPDVCIGGWFTMIFWAHSYVGLALSLIALTAVVPRLITRDRRTNALLVYLSRPLTSGDYLWGKLGMIVGVLVAMWTGPLLFAWGLSVAFAPNRDFIVYSFTPMVKALTFNGVALVALAAIALGASAISRTSRNTIAVWIGLWIVMWVASFPPPAPSWLKRSSFMYDLGQVRQGVFRLDEAVGLAIADLPILSQSFVRDLRGLGRWAQPTDFDGAMLALGAFVLLAAVMFLRKLKPE